MKKRIISISCVLLLIGAISCTGNNKPEQEEETNQETIETLEQENEDIEKEIEDIEQATEELDSLINDL